MKIVKYVLCLISVLVFGILINQIPDVYAGDPETGDWSVIANTSTAVLARPITWGRKYMLIVNEDDTYVIRRATWNLTADDANKYLSTPKEAPKGLPISNDYGSWEDEYNIARSSWWVIIQGGGSASAAKIEAVVSGTERF